MKLWRKFLCAIGIHVRVTDYVYTSLDFERENPKYGKCAFAWADIKRHCKHCGMKEEGWIM